VLALSDARRRLRRESKERRRLQRRQERIEDDTRRNAPRPRPEPTPVLSSAAYVTVFLLGDRRSAVSVALLLGLLAVLSGGTAFALAYLIGQALPLVVASTSAGVLIVVAQLVMLVAAIVGRRARGRDSEASQLAEALLPLIELLARPPVDDDPTDGPSDGDANTS
jgi:hypothetical protein